MIRSEIKEAIAIVTIDHPERRNALGSQLMRDLGGALSSAEQNGAVRVVVLTGVPPAFCAGSDLKELAGLSIPDMCKHKSEPAAFARAIGYRTKPVIAAVEGHALGGGFILAASCDIVVSSSTAGWHLPEAPNGWLPPWGLASLVARTGPVRARRLTWGPRRSMALKRLVSDSWLTWLIPAGRPSTRSAWRPVLPLSHEKPSCPPNASLSRSLWPMLSAG
ncbi:enoyl-CoA hydratase/isomerase family protein [Bradyrhizobium valentinum]|uniref:enoyl-CoA hydratase/isomerase family protein n=1 Tax=Bradyrhizobium valentinum TaxID=1518501 RepID=UPI000B10246D|nr:enoyl-CoA hydratase/isomerase family protein [Bradyrhizobium valentinum]